MSIETTSKKLSGQNLLFRYLPILDWLSHYKPAWLTADLIAGFTIWGVLVPENIAYAGLAGLAAQAGLYTLLVSLPLYALFGTSRQVVVYATSASAAVLASTIAALNPSTTSMYYSLAEALVLLVGVVFLLAGLFKLGFITNFLSRPLMDGFIFGLAIFIVAKQLYKLFGISKGSGNTFQQLWHVITNLGNTNLPTLMVGLGALVLLFGLPRLSRRIPSPLIVLVLGILVSTVWNLSAHGVKVVGAIPAGLPSVSLPQIPLSDLGALLSGAVGLSLVIFSEALPAVDVYATKYGYETDPNQELLAMGVVNLGSAFVGGLAAGGAVSGSAVNDSAGAKSPVSLLTAAVLVLITVIALTPLFTNLPEAVLAALIIHAVTRLMRVKRMVRFYHLRRAEFWLAMVTLLSVLAIDVLPGLIIGVVCSLAVVIYRSSRPYSSVLGQVPEAPGVYSDMQEHPENKTIPGLLIFQLSMTLYFANARLMRDRLRTLVKESQPRPNTVLIDMVNNYNLDITSAEMLENLVEEFHKDGIEVALAGVREPVKHMARHSGLMEKIGENHIYPSVDAAVQSLAPDGKIGAFERNSEQL
jgi:high affinity sulfate transporter 1